MTTCFNSVMLAAPASAQGGYAVESRAGCERAPELDRPRCESEAAEAGAALLILHALGQPVVRPRELRLPVSQIRADLGFLQAAADYLSNAAARSGELNLKAVAKAAAEVRKRADRLKDNLALPAPEGGAGRRREQVPPDPRQLRAALSALSARISDAARIPVLTGYLMDAAGSAEARRTLDEIVALSERIEVITGASGKGVR